ncbi:MAG: 50S ribosomal protein L23 [Gammaproteobacteria bacterium]
MSQERLMSILLSPHVSEKSARASDGSRQFVFKVVNNASKPEIRDAVELLFDVQVEGVQVLNVKGKTKRFGGNIGKRSDWKKAYVKLKEGFDIDFAGQ